MGTAGKLPREEGADLASIGKLPVRREGKTRDLQGSMLHVERRRADSRYLHVSS